MKINNSYYEDGGKSFQEIMSQLLVIYYNEKLVKKA